MDSIENAPVVGENVCEEVVLSPQEVEVVELDEDSLDCPDFDLEETETDLEKTETVEQTGNGLKQTGLEQTNLGLGHEHGHGFETRLGGCGSSSTSWDEVDSVTSPGSSTGNFVAKKVTGRQKLDVYCLSKTDETILLHAPPDDIRCMHVSKLEYGIRLLDGRVFVNMLCSNFAMFPDAKFCVAHQPPDIAKLYGMAKTSFTIHNNLSWREPEAMIDMMRRLKKGPINYSLRPVERTSLVGRDRMHNMVEAMPVIRPPDNHTFRGGRGGGSSMRGGAHRGGSSLNRGNYQNNGAAPQQFRGGGNYRGKSENFRGGHNHPTNG